jgi:uncharacterized protein (TIGR03067 family)
MTFLFDGRVKNTCKFTLDPKKSPKAIDLRKVTPSGEVSDGSMLAAYRLDGDSLLFAHGNKRPTDLEGKRAGDYASFWKRKR